MIYIITEDNIAIHTIEKHQYGSVIIHIKRKGLSENEKLVMFSLGLECLYLDNYICIAIV